MDYSKQLNPTQFAQMVKNIPDSMLSQLVSTARSQGIKEKEIETGLKIINNLRK